MINNEGWLIVIREEIVVRELPSHRLIQLLHESYVAVTFFLCGQSNNIGRSKSKFSDVTVISLSICGQDKVRSPLCGTTLGTIQCRSLFNIQFSSTNTESYPKYYNEAKVKT